MHKHAIRGDLTIKLAPEVQDDSVVTVKIEDFGIPADDQQVRIALLAAADTLSNGGNVYVGCLGGIGRTGTFLSILGYMFARRTTKNPVAWVRANYLNHAVERPSQEAYIDRFLHRHRDLASVCRAILRASVPAKKKPKDKNTGVIGRVDAKHVRDLKKAGGPPY